MSYTSTNVKEVIRETPDAVTLVLDLPNLNYQSGQFLDIVFDINSTKINRSYSFSSCFGVDKYPSVTIKKVHNGVVSSFANDALKAGDSIQVSQALGHFILKDVTNIGNIVFFGAGSGITPLLSMIKSILVSNKSIKIALVYANSNESNIIFKNHLEKLATDYKENFQVIHVISKPSPSWVGLKGRINTEMTLALVEQIPVIFPSKAHYYLCGPNAFMQEVKKGLSLLKVPENQIFSEKFELAAATAPKTDFTDSMVKIKHRKNSYELKVPAGKTILESAQAAKINIPYSCQGGVCSACMGKCISGKIKVSDDQSALSQGEIDSGYILTCLGYVLSETAEIQID